jgi:hypothetical protein
MGKSKLANGRLLGSAKRRFQSTSASEIQFLAYRLEVVRSWPDSARKQATLEAISLRLRAASLPASE